MVLSGFWEEFMANFESTGAYTSKIKRVMISKEEIDEAISRAGKEIDKCSILTPE